MIGAIVPFDRGECAIQAANLDQELGALPIEPAGERQCFGRAILPFAAINKLDHDVSSPFDGLLASSKALM